MYEGEVGWQWVVCDYGFETVILHGMLQKVAGKSRMSFKTAMYMKRYVLFGIHVLNAAK
jgi:hypothetical protein